MKTKLMVTLFMLIAGSVSYAQDYDDDIEVVEKNVAREADSDSNQEDYSKSKMDAYDTKNSPQINIYNANSNANKQQQRAKQQAEAEALADAEAEAQSRSKNTNTSEFGAEYIARANDLRKDRKDMEVGTEQKMIEKIEYSRMEDERDRANRLFGNRLDKKYDNDYKNEDYSKPAPPQVIVVEKKPEYVAPVAPTPAYENEVKTSDSGSLWGKESYIAPMVGTMNYSAGNVRADSALGVAIGNRFDTNVSAELSFLYSALEMDDYTITTGQDFYGNNVPGLKDVNQYAIGGGVKYNFDMGRVSPFVGALAAYTWRDYTETRGNGEATDSNAIDAGLNLGLDVKLAKNFSIGAEYRWMKNVWYDRNEPDTSNVQFDYPNLDSNNLEPLEESGYSALLVNGKFTF